MKINYKPDMQFSVTFDNGKDSEVQDIPLDGTALVCTPDGKKMAVVALGNHDGPLAANTAYVLSASVTAITGEQPTSEDYEMIEDDEYEDDEIEGDEEEDDDVELDTPDEGELGDEDEE